MQTDSPISFLDIIKTHKRIDVKGNHFIKTQFEQHNASFSKPKTHLPALNQPNTDSQFPSDSPSTYMIPIKSFNMKQQRSSSIGNVSKQIGMRRVQGVSRIEIQERTPSRERGCAESYQPAYPIFYHNRQERPSTMRKSSVGRERTWEGYSHQESSIRVRNEITRVSLNSISNVEKDAKLSTCTTQKTEQSSQTLLKTADTEPDMKDLVFGPSVPESVMVKHVMDVVRGVRYAINKVKPLPEFMLRPMRVSLKRTASTSKKSLVLDLDETLICARRPEDLKNKEASVYSAEVLGFNVMIRPFAIEFLRMMSKEFEIIIFTAAEKNYAECMVKLLDPEQKYISHILHRENCLRTKRGLMIKDLRIISDRQLKDMVIVDNLTPSFSFQVDNGIPIITWDGDQEDQELLYLMPYLLEAKKYNDMRQYNRERLRLEELAKVMFV